MKILIILTIICTNTTISTLGQNCYPELTSQFNQIILKQHNYIRTHHSAQPLSLDLELIKYSTDWSKTLSQEGRLNPSQRSSGYGENLWITTGPEKFDPELLNPVEDWYDEIDAYSFSDPKYSVETGHFTQLVWRSSVKVGCGICTHNSITVVSCRYKPAGNVFGQFEENVIQMDQTEPTFETTPATSAFKKYYQMYLVLGLIVFLLAIFTTLVMILRSQHEYDSE